MLLLIVVALLIPNIYATTTNQPNTEIITNTSISQDNITAYNAKTTLTQSTSAAGSPGSGSDATSTTNSQSTGTSTSTSNSIKKQSSTNIQYAQAAAGDSNVQNNWFTNTQITEAAGRVKTYIETNKRLPNFVTIGTVQVTMPQFLQLLTTGLIQVNKGTTTKIQLKSVGTAPNISENIKSGSLKKTEYLNLATSIQSYINTNSRAPNYATSTLGKVGFQSLIYMYSNIMGYHNTNKALPSTVSLKPWGTISTTTPTNPTQPAGNTSGTTSFTISQIGKAAGDVKAFVEKNDRLPNFVEINGKNITMPQFLKLLTTSLVQINGNKLTSIALKSAGAPSSPSEDVKSGNIDKSGYVDLANRILKYMDSNGNAPNFASSTLGKIRYETLIYLESRIVYFYTVNKVLPKYAAVNPWETSTTPPSNNQYLRATEDAPSNSQTIINLAKSITAGKTTELAKATAIFNWVRDNISYSFYYDTVKGALGTLSSRKGNCVDTTHLLVALNRASGIQTRYEHGVCKFADGTFGHVWAQVYVNGKWYRADAISPRNTFGVINNWDTSSWTQIGIYAELLF
jgi:hypothetical protein